LEAGRAWSKSLGAIEEDEWRIVRLKVRVRVRIRIRVRVRVRVESGWRIVRLKKPRSEGDSVVSLNLKPNPNLEGP